MERVFVHKHCLECGEEYVPNSATQKYCSTCAPRAKRQRHGVWRAVNCDKYHAMNAVWSKEHPENKRASQSRWRKAHPEEYRRILAEWVAGHPHNHYVSQLKWNAAHPNVIKGLRKKYNSKRRTLGFNPLNSFISGCEAHHINKDDIIYIPKALHHSVPHSVWTGKNIDKMNALAGAFLTEDWT